MPRLLSVILIMMIMILRPSLGTMSCSQLTSITLEVSSWNGIRRKTVLYNKIADAIVLRSRDRHCGDLRIIYDGNDNVCE